MLKHVLLISTLILLVISEDSKSNGRKLFGTPETAGQGRSLYERRQSVVPNVGATQLSGGSVDNTLRAVHASRSQPQPRSDGLSTQTTAYRGSVPPLPRQSGVSSGSFGERRSPLRPDSDALDREQRRQSVAQNVRPMQLSGGAPDYTLRAVHARRPEARGDGSSNAIPDARYRQTTAYQVPPLPRQSRVGSGNFGERRSVSPLRLNSDALQAMAVQSTGSSPRKSPPRPPPKNKQGSSPRSSIQSTPQDIRTSFASSNSGSTSSKKSLDELDSKAYYIVANNNPISPNDVSQIVYGSNGGNQWKTGLLKKRWSHIRNNLNEEEKERTEVSIVQTKDALYNTYYVFNHRRWNRKGRSTAAGNMILCVTDKNALSLDTYKALWEEKQNLEVEYINNYCKWKVHSEDEFIWLTYVHKRKRTDDEPKLYSFNSCTLSAESGGQISMCQCEYSSLTTPKCTKKV